MSNMMKILLVSLYSDHYPAVGESLGLSQIAGCILNHFKDTIDYFKVIDMVSYGRTMTGEYIEEVKNNKPNIICFSINYGTYAYFEEVLNATRQELSGSETLYILGGPIPTYRPDIFTEKKDSSIVVVRGEGDEAVRKIISSYYTDSDFSNISNISYFANGKTHTNKRKLVNLSDITYLSYRKHHIDNNAAFPVYVERSRGCNWAQCSFCLRGLLDDKGISNEYRLFDCERVFAELSELRKIKKSIITFSDEDFLTGNIELDNDFLRKLLDYKLRQFPDMKIILSTSVRKIFNSSWTINKKKKAEAVLGLLRRIGIERLFIGVESGSPTQLRRYNKPHSVEDARNVIRILDEMEISYEIGFIMFDPLCSLKEVEENINFIVENNILRNVSSINNSLRLQRGSRYFELVDDNEICHLSEPDDEALTYKYRCRDTSVQRVLDNIGRVKSAYDSLHYPLKSYWRAVCPEDNGEGKVILQRRLIDLRQLYFDYLVNTINCVKENRDNTVNDVLFLSSLEEIARDVQDNMHTRIDHTIFLPL